MNQSGLRLHIRRCHICGEVTEAEGKLVLRCKDCGKPMAPFYFFNEREAPILTDSQIRPPSVPPLGGRIPIRGFTAYW